jgi:hypothetical protein
MALYPTCRYSTLNIELIHGYLTILIVCLAMSYAPSSYIIMLSLALSINIDLVCIQACSSLTPVYHHGGGARGVRLVILVHGHGAPGMRDVSSMTASHNLLG